MKISLDNLRAFGFYYSSLLMDKFSLEFFQKTGRQGGKARSAKKAAASANNGKLGGRPKGSKKGKPR